MQDLCTDSITTVGSKGLLTHDYTSNISRICVFCIPFWSRIITIVTSNQARNYDMLSKRKRALFLHPPWSTFNPQMAMFVLFDESPECFYKISNSHVSRKNLNEWAKQSPGAQNDRSIYSAALLHHVFITSFNLYDKAATSCCLLACQPQQYQRYLGTNLAILAKLDPQVPSFVNYCVIAYTQTGNNLGDNIKCIVQIKILHQNYGT